MAPERDPLARGFPRAPEPFGVTANRVSYAAREATENALGALRAAIRGAEPVTLLSGPPGIGKTLLLHVLAHQLASEVHAVFLPYVALTPDELCAVVLDRLEAPRTEDSSGMLGAYARHLLEENSALVVLVDDVGAVPTETLRWCCETARSSGGALRFVFALTDDVHSTEVAAGMGVDAVRVRLDRPMTPAETADYVELQLAVGRVSGAVKALFDERVVADLHRTSGGVPRRLHTAAQALLRSPPEPSRETPPVKADLPANPDAAPRAPEDGAPESAASPEPEPVPRPPAPGADTPISPAIREEIERLRRDAGRAPRAEPVGSPRRTALTLAFGAAVVVGLVMATVYKPFSTFFVMAPTHTARFPAAATAPAALDSATQAAPEEPVAEAPVAAAVPEVAEEFAASATEEEVAVPGAAEELADPETLAAAAVPAEVALVPEPETEETAAHAISEPTAAPAAARAAEAIAAVTPEVDVLESAEEAAALEAPTTEVAEPPIPEPPTTELAAAPIPVPTPAPETTPPAIPDPSTANPVTAPATPEPAQTALSSGPPVPVAVNINASPWAEIEVDGNPLGETPLAGVTLLPGPHRFRARLPDGRVIERDIIVDPDEPFIVFGEAAP